MRAQQSSSSIMVDDKEIFAINITGYVGGGICQILSAAESASLDQSARNLYLNLGSVEGMDGSGLQLLTIFILQLRNHGFSLSVTSAPNWLREVFRLTCLDSLLTYRTDDAVSGAVPSSDNARQWSAPVKRIEWPGLPADANAVNAHRRVPLAPFSGFGPLLQRTYRVALPGINLSPLQVMDIWREKFTTFWPQGNDLFASAPGITPGAPAVIHLSLPGGIKLFTGALVMHSSSDSFSLMTLQGHMFCGWITFSSFIENGVLYIQTQALLRPSDALFDLSFRLGFGTRAEDSFWHASLLNLASNFGVEGKVQQTNRLIDNHIQWKHFGNLRYNAGIRSVIYLVTHPFRSRRLAHKG